MVGARYSPYLLGKVIILRQHKEKRKLWVTKWITGDCQDNRYSKLEDNKLLIPSLNSHIRIFVSRFKNPKGQANRLIILCSYIVILIVTRLSICSNFLNVLYKFLIKHLTVELWTLCSKVLVNSSHNRILVSKSYIKFLDNTVKFWFLEKNLWRKKNCVGNKNNMVIFILYQFS